MKIKALEWIEECGGFAAISPNRFFAIHPMKNFDLWGCNWDTNIYSKSKERLMGDAAKMHHDHLQELRDRWFE
jgi:hypothetical protein